MALALQIVNITKRVSSRCRFKSFALDWRDYDKGDSHEISTNGPFGFWRNEYLRA